MCDWTTQGWEDVFGSNMSIKKTAERGTLICSMMVCITKCAFWTVCIQESIAPNLITIKWGHASSLFPLVYCGVVGPSGSLSQPNVTVTWLNTLLEDLVYVEGKWHRHIHLLVTSWKLTACRRFLPKPRACQVVSKFHAFYWIQRLVVMFAAICDCPHEPIPHRCTTL